MDIVTISDIAERYYALVKTTAGLVMYTRADVQLFWSATYIGDSSIQQLVLDYIKQVSPSTPPTQIITALVTVLGLDNYGPGKEAFNMWDPLLTSRKLVPNVDLPDDYIIYDEWSWDEVMSSLPILTELGFQLTTPCRDQQPLDYHLWYVIPNEAYWPVLLQYNYPLCSRWKNNIYGIIPYLSHRLLQLQPEITQLLTLIKKRAVECTVPFVWSLQLLRSVARGPQLNQLNTVLEYVILVTPGNA